MTSILVNLYQSIRQSFWFLPAVMALAAVLLAWFAGTIDREYPDVKVLDVFLLYSGGPEGARQLLSTVAGSMITVAGVTFSITIVALTLASSQFGPRLLPTFMRDRGTQFVLGTFVACFVYCVLVLRTIRGGEDATFVPHLSITIAVLLTLVSLAVLIFFFHHVSASIQADTVIADVTTSCEHALENRFPSRLGNEPPSAALADPAVHEQRLARGSCPVHTRTSGYVQGVNPDRLFDLARERDLVIMLKFGPGDFVVTGDVLMHAYPRAALDAELREKLAATYMISKNRTRHQDVEFALTQLVEIALRALSPGINDPFTAISCIDQLSQVLSHAAEQPLPSPCRFDRNGDLRAIAPVAPLSELLSAAYTQIRVFAGGNPAVLESLVEALRRIGCRAEREADRKAVLMHLQRVARACEETNDEDDRDLLNRLYGRAIADAGASA